MAARLLAGIGAVMLLALALNHAMAGRVNPALLNLVAALVLGINALSLHYRRRPAYPYLALSLMLLAVICASVYVQGVPALFWAYPAVIINFFTLVVWRAIAVGSLTLVLVTVATALGPASELALRFALSLAFVLVMIAVVIFVVADLQQELLTQTFTDPLTGAYNRRRLSMVLEGSRPPKPQTASAEALVAIDVDHFKRINDQFGHSAGDAVLRNLARALIARKRAGDKIFRFGGEEFVMLLRRVNERSAMQAAESVRRTVAETELLAGHPVTVSVGVSVRLPEQDAEDWLKQADLALYRAKHEGRNRVVSARALSANHAAVT